MTMESSPDKENKQDSVNLDDSGYRSPGSSSGSLSPGKSLLSRSAGSVALHSSLSKARLNLSSSCFPDLCGSKDRPEGSDDLTSLSWLQENNLLKSLTSSPTAAPLSPTRENKRARSYQHTSFKDTVFWTSDDYAGEEEVDFVPKGDNQNCKPPYSFSSLIFMAIENSPSKCLPVKDIYSWIVEHFPYFRNAPLGWKNSVRHNLSLNKSFKKIEKDKNGVGKGSLWCIDSEFRPNLLHALRKTPAYSSLSFSSPPPSPGGSFNGGSQHHSNETRLPGVHSPSFDDAEFDAAATMCTMSTPPELRDQERERLRNKASTPADRTSPALLNYWRKYIEPLSDGESACSREGSPTYEGKDKTYTTSPRFTIEHLLADVGMRSSRRSLKRSADGIELHRLKCNGGSFHDEGVDNEFDLNNRSDDEDVDDDISDEEINENLRRLVERDTLGDSGYGGDLGSTSVICDHTYTKIPKLKVKEEETEVTADSENKHGHRFSDVDALLSLANAATQQLEQIKGEDS